MVRENLQFQQFGHVTIRNWNPGTLEVVVIKLAAIRKKILCRDKYTSTVFLEYIEGKQKIM